MALLRKPSSAGSASPGSSYKREESVRHARRVSGFTPVAELGWKVNALKLNALVAQAGAMSQHVPRARRPVAAVRSPPAMRARVLIQGRTQESCSPDRPSSAADKSAGKILLTAPP